MTGNGILNADMATMRGWFATGWRWWLDELAGVVPRRWRATRTGRLAIYAYNPELGEFALLPGPAGTWPRPDAPSAVVLPPALTLIRAIDYPAVGERDLAGLIELDRDRIMPQGRDALLAARVLARSDGIGPAGPRMQVEVAGLPLVRAQTLARALAGLPRAPMRILASAPQPMGLPPIDLLPALRRAGLIGGADRPATPLWLTVGFLFLLNIGLLVWRDSAALDDLSATIDQQQPAVGVAHRIIARMRSADRVAQATAEARRGREPVALMARIDQALPPGTWIQRLSWQGGTVQLAGYHPPRADVSGALRRAGLAVARYGDTSDEAPTPLGEPFEVTVRLGWVLMAALSPRESRLLAVLLLVAAAALVDVGVVQPVLGGFAARAQQRQELLARYAANDRLIGAIPRLGREAALRDRQLAGYALAAPDAASAADALRDRLQAAATAVGGDFHGAEDVVAPPGRPPDRIATRAALRLSAAQLTQFLIRVENARPFVTITALSVRADDTLITGQAATLEVTLEAAIAFRPAPPR